MESFGHPGHVCGSCASPTHKLHSPRILYKTNGDKLNPIISALGEATLFSYNLLKSLCEVDHNPFMSICIRSYFENEKTKAVLWKRPSEQDKQSKKIQFLLRAVFTNCCWSQVEARLQNLTSLSKSITGKVGKGD